MQPRTMSLLWPVLVVLVWLRGCSTELYAAGTLRQYLQEVVTDAVEQQCGEGSMLLKTALELKSSLNLLHAESCPDGWTHRGTSCYLIPQAPEISWYQAHRACAVLDRRARLASVHAETQQDVDGMLAARDVQYVWLGLSKLPGATDWGWSDGTELDFTDWKQGEPTNNGPSTGSQEQCVTLSAPGESGRGWNDYDCAATTNILCQIRLA